MSEDPIFAAIDQYRKAYEEAEAFADTEPEQPSISDIRVRAHMQAHLDSIKRRVERDPDLLQDTECPAADKGWETRMTEFDDRCRAATVALFTRVPATLAGFVALLACLRAEVGKNLEFANLEGVPDDIGDLFEHRLLDVAGR